jgi:GTPase SAR1 family protein
MMSQGTQGKSQTKMLTFKIVMIGDKSVGKTSIVKRYTDNTFSIGTESTIGAQFTSKIVTLEPDGVQPV